MPTINQQTNKQTRMFADKEYTVNVIFTKHKLLLKFYGKKLFLKKMHYKLNKVLLQKKRKKKEKKINIFCKQIISPTLKMLKNKQ